MTKQETKIQEYSQKLHLRNQQQELAIQKRELFSATKKSTEYKVSIQPEDYLQEVNIRN